MRQLWAPWRVAYISKEKPAGCIFCDAAARSDDRRNLIVHRGQHGFVIMNAFPYNTGHVMVVPYRHQSQLRDLRDEELLNLMHLTDLSIRAQTHALQAQGFNVGMNVGQAAGAGIEDHLHVHIVPRWVGDTNFMPVLSDVKVIPEHLQATYERLLEAYTVLTQGTFSRG